jgi:hypothetical protein
MAFIYAAIFVPFLHKQDENHVHRGDAEDAENRFFYKKYARIPPSLLGG